MSFGSSTPGGAVEGIGGYESDIGSGGDGGYQGLGIGNPGSYGGTNAPTATYSQEAMAAALAAADQQMMDNNLEYGLSADPNRGADGVGQVMDAYTSGHPEVADVMALQNRQNDWKTLGYGERERQRRAAEAVGMDTDYMGDANIETVREKILNNIGSVAGGAAGTAFGPIGSTLGTHFGGKLGSYVSGVRDDEEVRRAAGLLGPVVSPGTELYREGDKNSLAEQIIWPLRKGIRG